MASTLGGLVILNGGNGFLPIISATVRVAAGVSADLEWYVAILRSCADFGAYSSAEETGQSTAAKLSNNGY